MNENVILHKNVLFLWYTISERWDKRNKRQTIINSKLGNIFTHRTNFWGMYKIDFHCAINSKKISLCIGCFVCSFTSRSRIFQFNVTIVAIGLQTFGPCSASTDTGPCLVFIPKDSSNLVAFTTIKVPGSPRDWYIESKKRLFE